MSIKMNGVDSDSDEDGYGDFAKKLLKLKKKSRAFIQPVSLAASCKVDTVETIDLNCVSDITRNESNNIVSTLTRNDSDIIEVFDTPSAHIPVQNPESNLFLNDLITIPEQMMTRSSRQSRRKRKNSLSDMLEMIFEPPTRRGKKRGGRTPRRARGRNRGNSRDQSVSQPVVPLTPEPPTPRGARGRGRRARGRTPRRGSNRNSYIQTFSIGNTDDYPDFSENQDLFSKPTEPEPCIVDLEDSLTSDNEELSVKVLWQSLDVVKFNIRRHQKLSQIFEHFMKTEGVSKDRLLFTFNNKMLQPNDTPDSIEYNIGKFIEGGIVNGAVVPDSPKKRPKKKRFMLKFQCQSLKKPFELSVEKEDRLRLAMVKCAEHLEISIAKLLFKFDGETIHGNSTPAELDMDSGDCIDVKVISS